jgi:hypothetical protein
MSNLGYIGFSPYFARVEQCKNSNRGSLRYKRSFLLLPQLTFRSPNYLTVIIIKVPESSDSRALAVYTIILLFYKENYFGVEV